MLVYKLLIKAPPCHLKHSKLMDYIVESVCLLKLKLLAVLALSDRLLRSRAPMLPKTHTHAHTNVDARRLVSDGACMRACVRYVHVPNSF